MPFVPKGWEIVVILVIVLIIFGPKNLPKLGKAIGNGIKGLRKGVESGKEKIDEKFEEVEETKAEEAKAEAAAAAEVVVESGEAPAKEEPAKEPATEAAPEEAADEAEPKGDADDAAEYIIREANNIPVTVGKKYVTLEYDASISAREAFAKLKTALAGRVNTDTEYTTFEGKPIILIGIFSSVTTGTPAGYDTAAGRP